jgi:serine/threonine-protein kinase
MNTTCSTPGPFVSAPFPWDGDKDDIGPGSELQNGRFRLMEVVGAGGTAVVHKAHDNLRNAVVALKIARAGTCDIDTAAALIHYEASLAMRLPPHPNLLRVHDLHAFEYAGGTMVALSMEFADGGSLREWLVRFEGNLEKRCSMAKSLLRQVCNGVRALHNAGFVHHDLKPENCLFIRDRLVVADLAAASAHNNENIGLPATSIASIPVRMGTSAYMSPRQHLGIASRLGRRGDDFHALACIYFETVHPQCNPAFPFDQKTAQRLHAEGMWPALDEVTDSHARRIRKLLEAGR